MILGEFLCRPALQNVNDFSALSGEREPQGIIFKICISNFTLRSIFSFEIALTKRKKNLMTKEYCKIRR